MIADEPYTRRRFSFLVRWRVGPVRGAMLRQSEVSHYFSMQGSAGGMRCLTNSRRDRQEDSEKEWYLFITHGESFKYRKSP